MLLEEKIVPPAATGQVENQPATDLIALGLPILLRVPWLTPRSAAGTPPTPALREGPPQSDAALSLEMPPANAEPLPRCQRKPFGSSGLIGVIVAIAILTGLFFLGFNWIGWVPGLGLNRRLPELEVDALPLTEESQTFGASLPQPGRPHPGRSVSLAPYIIPLDSGDKP